jgi:hypothetical protein
LKAVGDAFTLDDNGGGFEPAGGAASGWLRLFEDEDKTVLSDEILCEGGVVEFSASEDDNDPLFDPNPDCKMGFGCFDRVENPETGLGDFFATSTINGALFFNDIFIRSDTETVPEPEPRTLPLLMMGCLAFATSRLFLMSRRHAISLRPRRWRAVPKLDRDFC